MVKFCSIEFSVNFLVCEDVVVALPIKDSFMQYWRVFVKGFELHMVRLPGASLFASEKIEVDIQGTYTQLWFPGLSMDKRYKIFRDLAVGKFTGTVRWQRIESNDEEYAFHLENC
jgi:hypothetical protein